MFDCFMFIEIEQLNNTNQKTLNIKTIKHT